MRAKKYLNEAQRAWTRDWWRALQPREAGSESLPGELRSLGRGERAELRRCRDDGELLGQAAVLLLADRLIALGGEQWPLPKDAIAYQRLAWVAGVLAQVRMDARDERSLAWHLGYGAGERPRMSELRFKRLQRAAAIDDLFLQWRRALQLAEGRTDVARLADDLLAWQLELEQTVGHASDGVRFRWAYDYYLSARERAAAEEPESNKELTL